MVDDIEDVVAGDLEGEFVRDLAVHLGWNYNQAFERLDNCPGLTDPCRNEMFARQRGYLATESMLFAAKKHGIPFEHRRLECNGQHKLMLQAGRLIIIQEPILVLGAKPQAAQYKQELAAAYGVIQQLEFDLGDRPLFIRPSVNTRLAVILHGAAGPKFTEEQKKLGALSLGIPNASYDSWLKRLDLYNIAMFGTSTPRAQEPEPLQEDRVIVQPKRRTASGDTDE